jgi:charged multivesicular body protein 6
MSQFLSSLNRIPNHKHRTITLDWVYRDIMGQLFGKSSKQSPRSSTREEKIRSQNVSEKDKATLELKNARNRLKKYRKRLEIDSQKLTEQAKEHLRLQQRDRAMLLLRLRKHKEKTVDEINNQLITVMQQIEDLEWASISVQVLNAIKAGTSLLNAIHEEISVDDVQSLLDETNEAIEVENQINALLAGSISSLDDNDLLAELDQLTANPNQVNIQLPQEPTGDITILPQAPEHDIKPKEANTADVERTLVEA